MSEERRLPPEKVEEFRRIRATLPHWGGGTHAPSPEADQRITSNIAESIARVLDGREHREKSTVKAMRCDVCGAVERLEGKRTVIVHDWEKHPKGEIPASQLDIKPMQRTREEEDYSRETYNERLAVGRADLRRLGSGD